MCYCVVYFLYKISVFSVLLYIYVINVCQQENVLPFCTRVIKTAGKRMFKLTHFYAPILYLLLRNKTRNCRLCKLRKLNKDLHSVRKKRDNFGQQEDKAFKSTSSDKYHWSQSLFDNFFLNKTHFYCGGCYFFLVVNCVHKSLLEKLIVIACNYTSLKSCFLKHFIQYVHTFLTTFIYKIKLSLQRNYWFSVFPNRDLTKPRAKQQQNNSSARASRIFVHFFAFTAQLRREMTKFQD